MMGDDDAADDDDDDDDGGDGEIKSTHPWLFNDI